MELGFGMNTTQSWNGITDGHYKYLFFPFDGSESLFNLDIDPAERNNIAYSKPNVTTVFRERLIDQFISEERGDDWIIGRELQLRQKVIRYSPNQPSSQDGDDSVHYYPYENVKEDLGLDTNTQMQFI